MPNTKSAKKELRKSKNRQIQNKKIKDNLKSLVKKTRRAIAAGDAQAKKLVAESLQMIDKAAQKGVIKNNTRDRKKSRLQRGLNQIAAKK